MRLDMNELDGMSRQNWLQHAIAPRPIAFVSTMDSEGQINLSPFSFFNLFSTTPPILIFSPARRLRDNTTKHTLENVLAVPEVVVNIVDYAIVQQMSLSSCEYPREVNEFIKAGFTMNPSEKVRPPRVKESKVQLECKVLEVKPLGTTGGSGNLVICEVLLMHVNDDILRTDGKMIDPMKLHQVARLGGDWYSKVDEQSLFSVEKPNTKLGIGMDALPANIRDSKILTGNHLGMLANVDHIPETDPGFTDPRVTHILHYFSGNPDDLETELHRHAAALLDEGKVAQAWQVLLSA